MIKELETRKSKWLRDLIRFLPLKSQFVLSGNVRDLQIEEKMSGAVVRSLTSCLTGELRAYGYSHVLCYDFVNGFKIVDPATDYQGHESGENLMKQLGLQPVNGCAPAGLELFEDVFEKVISWKGDPIVLIVDFASRLIIHANDLSDNEHRLFTRALIRSHEARVRAHGSPSKPFFNTILWVVEKEGDLPDWLTIDNSKVRHISLPNPDHQMRRALAGSLIQSLEGAKEVSAQLKDAALQSFVDNTEGLLLVDLMLIAQLCREEKLGYAKIGEAVRRYKVGVSEDPWQKIDRRKIRDGQNFIRERVKGQYHAVDHMLAIIKRAITGVGAPRRGGRPRGVAFLVGPTGVGKTELAKSITSLLFGDESAYIRFDMSEFSAEHSDQRLIGAPPGYVGYDMGGELTNAIREKPFSVVLFDEIEKAHPKILDKFLQILDDGVLTSGRGERVYFTEAFIVFTSNLGIYQTDLTGERKATVAPTDSFENIQKRIREEVENHFKFTLNRPEILNRIGDNIIVFDFIRDDIAEQIFKNMVGNVLADLKGSQEIEIKIRNAALRKLRDNCLSDLSNGGRGIRNKIETYLINPLSRFLFDKDIKAGDRLLINSGDLGDWLEFDNKIINQLQSLGGTNVRFSGDGKRIVQFKDRQGTVKFINVENPEELEEYLLYGFEPEGYTGMFNQNFEYGLVKDEEVDDYEDQQYTRIRYLLIPDGYTRMHSTEGKECIVEDAKIHEYQSRGYTSLPDRRVSLDYRIMVNPEGEVCVVESEKELEHLMNGYEYIWQRNT